jgi:hypothetical protein
LLDSLSPSSSQAHGRKYIVATQVWIIDFKSKWKSVYFNKKIYF